MTSDDNVPIREWLLRHTGYMEGKHVAHYKETGELQLPLFDVDGETWVETNSWASTIAEADRLRQHYQDGGA